MLAILVVTTAVHQVYTAIFGTVPAAEASTDVEEKSPGTSKKQNARSAVRPVVAVAAVPASAHPLDRIDPTWDDTPAMAFSTSVPVAVATTPTRPRVRAGTALQSPESIADKYANEFEAHA